MGGFVRIEAGMRVGVEEEHGFSVRSEEGWLTKEER
jgi:hypothetical protein